MRFLELRLIAFGGFEGLTLDFSAPGLHVVFGRNEAGKSTTLRALTHLLYGFPERTVDAYRFPMGSLRIGARLQADDGAVLDVVRKKGRTKTLLDREERPIDDAPLLRMLHGVSQEVYEASFGLTHGALQRGARALLEGGGDLGESLFQAGLGGGELHRFLVELREEAERIWSPAARNKPLNEAMRVIAEAKKLTSERSASHESYQSQVDYIEAQRARKATASEERSALVREQKRLQRLKGMLPIFAARAELERRRAVLGAVVLLPVDAPRDRADALSATGEAEAAIGRLEAEIADVLERRASLKAPDALADAAAELEGLHGALALYLKNEQELPRLRAEQSAEEAEARRIARSIAGEGGTPSGMRADAKAASRIRSLASEPKRIQALLRGAERARDDASAALSARPATAPEESDRVQGIAQRLARRWKGLGLATGDPAAVVALAVPSTATALRYEREMGAVAEEQRRAVEEEAALLRDAASIAREIDALQRAAAVPTEADLLDARARRDGLWTRLRASFDEKVAAEFEHASIAADEVADRLRREAERVTWLAKLLADGAATKDAIARVADLRASAAARGEELASAWRGEWTSIGITPLSAAEMRAWLERHAKLVETSDELEDAKADARRAHEAEQLRIAQDVARHERDLAAHAKELASWQEEWTTATRKLGLAFDLGVDEALAVVDELAALGVRVDAAEAHRARAEAAAAENGRIADRVRDLAARLAGDLAALPVTEAGQQLVRRFDLARQERTQRTQLDRTLDEKRAALVEQTARRDASAKKLAALLATAGASSLEELVVAEERSVAARALAADEERTRAVLLAKADGAPLDELAAEAVEARVESVDARLDEIETRLAEVGDEYDQAAVAIDRAERGLAELDRGDAAAVASGEAQAAVARAHELASRWARLRLADAVLTREIQRYREQHQGPVLGRASEVFARLTRGAYRGLRSGLDDDGENPILLAAKDGGDVPTALLSDGTRDQVYLALRVASLERHAVAAGPLPLVLDDILIQFDDERARAAIEVLAELASTAQVLFFTHHQRLVDLARAACPTGLTVHELARPPAATAPLVLTPS